MAIFFNFSLTSSHIYPMQVENCDSNSRLAVYEDDNGKFRLERVKVAKCAQISTNIGQNRSICAINKVVKYVKSIAFVVKATSFSIL